MKIGELESRKMRKKLSQRRQNTVEKGVVPKVLKKKKYLIYMFEKYYHIN